MALVDCKECGAKISDEAISCPSCGAKPPKKSSRLTWLIGAIFLVVMYQSCSTISDKLGQAPRAATAPAKAEAPPAAWQYQTNSDPMSGKPIRFAIVTSTNSLSLASPYSGKNFGHLHIRRRTGGADEAYVTFDQGQSMCRSYSNNCAVSIRFDDGPPVTLAGQTPSDGSSDTVFLTPASKVVAGSRKAKSIKISLVIYKAGNQVFEFATPSPLDW